MTKLTREEKIDNALRRHPDKDDGYIAQCADVHVVEVKAQREGRPLTMESSPTPAPESGLISLDKVIQKYDIRSAILRELALIPKGKLISEVELCQRAAGTDKNRFRRTVENNEAEFRPLRILLKLDEGEKRWYWADRETVEAAQRMRDL
jgi:hypothetical protein